MMNIAFRVDASDRIGTGHVMRCLTLADGLKQRGWRIRFVSRHMLPHLRQLIEQRSHEHRALSGPPQEGGSELSHASWLGTTQEADAQETLDSLADREWDWLVVDHYAIDHRWETSLREHARRIMVIDDLADRVHDCDMLLDQNYYRDMHDRYTGKVPASCVLLLGPAYALLRNEFAEKREAALQRGGKVGRMLVFFGGIDRDNYTMSAIDALHQLPERIRQVDVVIGAMHPFRKQIVASCEARGFACHIQTDRISELIASADLAIGAGGVNTWERCCLGLPTLTICTADNQRQQLRDAAMAGLVYAPDSAADRSESIVRHVSALIDNAPLRRLLSRQGMTMVDGLGVERICGRLDVREVEIRKAEPDDCARLFEWRNHPEIRSVSRQSDAIDWEQHQKWFASVIASSNRILLIGEYNGEPVGVVRFDVDGSASEISIYLVPGQSHRIKGGQLLESAERWLANAFPAIRTIVAEVLPENMRSQRFFQACGYQATHISYVKTIH